MERSYDMTRYDLANVVLRTATIDDLSALVEIHNHYVLNTHITFDLDPYTPETRRPWFDAHDGERYRIVVADAGGAILGSASSGQFRRKGAYDTTVETSIVCRPDALGMGLGTRLYQELFRQLAQQDVHRAVAGIAQPNEASNALHRKMGFRAIGTYSEVGRKFGKYWDVLWLEREL